MRTHAIFAGVALCAVAACSDRSPTASAPAPPPRVTVAFDCSVTVATRTVQCAEAQPHAIARGDVILGGSYVQLTSQNVHYDGYEDFTFDVAVKNLIPQKIGTTDGTTVAADGVRAFFSSGPTVTAGSGAIWVEPDGIGTFTGPNQPYYEYAQILATNAQSKFHTWTLHMPPTVINFTFILYVSAPVQFPDGWVTITPDSSYVPVDDESNLTAVAYNAIGTVVPGATFTWSSSNPSVATISSGGVMVAMDIGTAIITATSGARTGTAKVVVF
ncbi:MAG TPA: Ig-like domain-containing protein [Longimicrobium sp.]|jgi:uncharacterized protein YjdB|nr:Ig-like domain-containing protein [Longimicrobium sp.]